MKYQKVKHKAIIGPKSIKSATSQVAIYVPSCDAYSDLWKPFFELLWRHWPDCPFKIYLGANTNDYADSRICTIKSDKGMVWADRCLDHLGHIEEPIILLWLEDFFLRRRVDTSQILAALNDFTRMDAHVFRLVGRPAPKQLIYGKYFGELEVGAAYRISTQAAFWNKEFFRSMIVAGESIWQFEIDGSRRCNIHRSGFYGVMNDLLPYGHHVVERGRWFPWAAWYYGRMNIGCDFSRRAIMPASVTAKWLLRKMAGKIGLGRIKKLVLR